MLQNWPHGLFPRFVRSYSLGELPIVPCPQELVDATGSADETTQQCPTWMASALPDTAKEVLLHALCLMIVCRQKDMECSVQADAARYPALVDSEK